METAIKLRPISTIAYDVLREWNGKVNYAAKPYLAAMFDFETINDKYGADSARSVVLYFLGNASSFRGERAKQLKQELKDHLKG